MGSVNIFHSCLHGLKKRGGGRGGRGGGYLVCFLHNAVSNGMTVRIKCVHDDTDHTTCAYDQDQAREVDPDGAGSQVERERESMEEYSEFLNVRKVLEYGSY